MFKIIIEKNYEAVSEVAFEVFRPVMDLENPVLGLATGSSPVGLYKKMIEDHQKNGTSYAKAISFNLDEYVGLLDANKDYKLTIDLKKVNNKYTIVYSIDGNVLKTLVANYGEDEFKFFFIAEAAANRPWMKWAKLDKALTKHLETKFNFIEYTAY